MSGTDLIVAERERQKKEEHWTPEHDAIHKHGELALAAIAYAAEYPVKVQLPMSVHGDENCGCREADCPHRRIFPTIEKKWVDPWPWDDEWDKRAKHDRIRRLVIAGALIAAEIDRLQDINTKVAAMSILVNAALFVKSKSPCPDCGRISRKGSHMVGQDNPRIFHRVCSKCKREWDTIENIELPHRR